MTMDKTEQCLGELTDVLRRYITAVVDEADTQWLDAKDVAEHVCIAIIDELEERS